MNRLLVSACLLGQPVRYDGRSNESKIGELSHWLAKWQEEGRVIPVCPETLGGLPTPRPAAEIQALEEGSGQGVLAGKAKIITQSGLDVSADFIQGAQKTLEIAKREQATGALLAARSPSCGKGQIYDGSFSGKLTTGDGVTVAWLEAQSIRCFNPEEYQALILWMQS